MSEHPTARAFTDGRIQTIHGGTTGIMKEIIGRSTSADPLVGRPRLPGQPS